MPTRTVNAVEVTADKIVCALIDRLVLVEKKYDALRKEVEMHMELIAEQQPRVDDDGNVKLLACSDDIESDERFSVKFTPSIVKTIK